MVRKKASYPLDGIPLVIGIAGLLKQFHPQTTRCMLEYIGQFVRSMMVATIGDAVGSVENDGGKAAAAAELPVELINMVIFVDQLCIYSALPRQIVHEFIPAYVFDVLKISS